MEGLCYVCKTHREMKDPKLVTLPGGTKAYRGICVVCGNRSVYKQG